MSHVLCSAASGVYNRNPSHPLPPVLESPARQELGVATATPGMQISSLSCNQCDWGRGLTGSWVRGHKYQVCEQLW